jgi:hypothetical protein
MHRFLSVPLVTALTLPALAAPRPKDDRPVPYHPTRVGTRWVYELCGEEQTREITESKETASGETRVTISLVTTKGKEKYEVLSVSAKGLSKVGLRMGDIEPYSLLKLPPKAAESWAFEVDPQHPIRGEKGTITIGKEQDVEVPGGMFRAVPVRMEVTVVGNIPLRQPQRTERWYAPEVGLVKMSYGNGDRILRLKSFSLGK